MNANSTLLNLDSDKVKTLTRPEATSKINDRLRRRSMDSALTLFELTPDSMEAAVERIEEIKDSNGIFRFSNSNQLVVQRPRVIVRSQSGRPFLVRPAENSHPLMGAKAKDFDEALGQYSIDRSVDARTILSTAAESAAAALSVIGRTTTQREVENWFRGWARYKMDSRTCFSTLLRSLAVCLGDRPIDIAYALGAFWRQQVDADQTAVVSLLDSSRSAGCRDGRWVAYGLDQLAFGPSPTVASAFLREMHDQNIQIQLV